MYVNNIKLFSNKIQEVNKKRIFLVIGSTNNSFGQYLIKKFFNEINIKFLGAIYDTQVLNNLRYHSNLYFHGHSVGGTNPSLLEAMASSSLICAHQNVFNKAILGADSYYFENSNDIAMTMDGVIKEHIELDKVRNNYKKIIADYNWVKIIEQYESLFISALPLRRY